MAAVVAVYSSDPVLKLNAAVSASACNVCLPWDLRAQLRAQLVSNKFLDSLDTSLSTSVRRITQQGSPYRSLPWAQDLVRMVN